MKSFLTAVVAGCALVAAGNMALAQSAAFTYQGRLTDSGQSVNGLYDFTFSLFDTNGVSVGGPLTNSGVGVTNGLFTVTLDFGTQVFSGSNIWLEISVSTNGANAFSTLSPRQSITPAPWALTANNLSGPLPSASLGGTYNGAVALNNPSNSFAGDGSGLTNLNAGALTSGIVATARMGTLSNHTDVTLGGMAVGNVLTYNGVTWTNNPVTLSSNGAGLTNLNASALATGIVPTAQMGTLSNHTDVTLGGMASGNVLTYNGTTWTNNPLSLPSNGNYLTNVNASAITGVIPPAQAGSLSNHTDVTLGGMAVGNVLIYNGTTWTNNPVTLPSNGAGLTNLNASALTIGVVPTAQMGSLTNHTDVAAPGLVGGQVLVYSGTAWTNAPLPSSGGGGGSGPSVSNNIPVLLSYATATNVPVNAALGTHFRLVATNNFQLLNPTNASDAQRMIFEIIQDSAGGHTMTLGSAFKLGTDIPFVNLTTNANLRDFMTCVTSGTNFYVVGFVKGY
jgi:hypothetical protein